jgi:hypothetical protein
MKRLIRSHYAWLVLALGAAALSACKNDDLDGTYTATTFTYANTGAVAQDVLAAGGSISLTISHDMTTSGSMSIPASATGSSAFNVGLLGTAARDGDSVRLNLVQDSFLRDIIFTFDGSALSGTGTFSGVTVVVTLSK